MSDAPQAQHSGAHYRGALPPSDDLDTEPSSIWGENTREERALVPHGFNFANLGEVSPPLTTTEWTSDDMLRYASLISEGRFGSERFLSCQASLRVEEHWMSLIENSNLPPQVDESQYIRFFGHAAIVHHQRALGILTQENLYLRTSMQNLRDFVVLQDRWLREQHEELVTTLDDHGDILSHLCEQDGRLQAHLDSHVRNIAQEAVEANTTVLRAELERLGEIVERSPLSADSTDVLVTDIRLFNRRIYCL